MKKICAHCHEDFETNNPQKIYCDRVHYRPCPVCGQPVKMYDNDFSRRPACCSNECKHKLRKSKFKPKICVLCGKTFTPNSGCQTACQNTHYDNCEICGASFIRTVSNKIDGITTCSKECTQKKLRLRSLQKYGTEHPMQCKEVQNNFHEAMKAKYGYEHALQVPEIKIRQEATNLEQFGTIHACLSEPCMQNQVNLKARSRTNERFEQLLLQSNISVESEFRLDRFSYDFKLVQSNILIEIDPTYTHNALGNHLDKQGKSKYYHRDKSQLAEDNGYRCIHVWDWEDWDIIIKQLSSKVVLPVSDFHVYRLTKEATNGFLERNDTHGQCRGQLLCLGLIKDGEIYQVMTFGKSKYDTSYDIQLLRMCTRLGYEIDGGYDVLSHSASREFGVDRCIMYVDKSKLYSQECESIGMKLERETPPSKIWAKGKTRIYDSIVRAPYTKYTPEGLLSAGYLPVYDCGQRVYVF